MQRILRNPLIAMVLGPMIWSVHFVLIYSLLSVGCALDWHAVSVAGLDVVRLVLLIVTAIAVLPLLWLMWQGWRGWKEATGEMDSLRSRAGAALALLSLVAVLWEAMAVPLVGPCL